METYNHVLFFKLLHMRKGINIDMDMPLDGSSPLLVLAFLLNSALGPLRSKFTHSCTSSISHSFGAAETTDSLQVRGHHRLRVPSYAGLPPNGMDTLQLCHHAPLGIRESGSRV